MKKLKFVVAFAASLVALPFAVSAQVNENAGFVNVWHGVGSDHQNNNEPGDTAADRHNFGDATAGGSDQKPTSGSAQDPEG